MLLVFIKHCLNPRFLLKISRVCEHEKSTTHTTLALKSDSLLPKNLFLVTSVKAIQLKVMKSAFYFLC